MPEGDWPSIYLWSAAMRNRLVGLLHPNSVPPKKPHPQVKLKAQYITPLSFYDRLSDFPKAVGPKIFFDPFVFF